MTSNPATASTAGSTADSTAGRNLVAHEIQLSGRHLIEASAGTGKTFNITRIYLRLLLERRLGVEQILVMTFTKDATEEIRGRIDAFIRQAINDWDHLSTTDDYFISLASKVSRADAKVLLKRALLYLDEAAIFTIHGFCKRVLNQHAFASGLVFNAQMETNCQDLVLQACQDWYRVLGQASPELFLLVAQFWPDPQGFLNNFAKAISQTGDMELISASNILDDFKHKLAESLLSLEQNQQTLFTYLVEVKKGNDRQTRLDEYNRLLHWHKNFACDLDNQTSDNVDGFINSLESAENLPDAFLDGRRYSRAKHKQQLVDIFAPVNVVKSQYKKLHEQLCKAQAFALVKQGVIDIRQAVALKKQQLNMLSFDDLISTLANRLNTQQDTKLATTLFEQFPVALIDEFQDTDPQQFEILKAIYYVQPSAALYLIGDPKQAIYGFRGGDVFAYLSARQDCEHHWFMDTNWRSSAAMITGYNRLFYGDKLSGSGKPVFGYNIPYLPVKPSPHADHRANHLAGAKALQFIHFEMGEQDGKSVKQSFRAVMANWCAQEIVSLLNHGLAGNDSAGADPSVLSQDIAILVRDTSEANAVKLALLEQGLACVYLSNRANLLHSEQTGQLLALLKGILFVENDRLFTAALACGLLGFTPDRLYQLQHDDLGWQNLKFAFAGLRDEWNFKGFISMALKLMHEHFRLAAQDQDRVLTNLLHLFELLQGASQRHRQPQELFYWFEQQGTLDNPESEAELRLESDDNLIRIITQHGAKGMEYPVVFIPFATRHKDPLKFGNRALLYIESHDEAGKLCLSLGGSEQAKIAMRDEAHAEAIRLLYVAITRAKQRCYVLSTGFDHYHDSPLGRTLKWQKDQDILPSLQQLANDNSDAISVRQITQLPENSALIQGDIKVIEPQVARFHGRIERDWWLSSFSALSKNLRHSGVSGPDHDNDLHKNPLINEAQQRLLAEQSSLAQSQDLLRFNLSKGAHTGNLLHDILQYTDFVTPNWSESLKWPLVKYGELTPGYSEQDLQNWLEQVLNTPLAGAEAGQSMAKCCLAGISLQQSLRETEFYFPMDNASSAALAQVLSEHRNRQASLEQGKRAKQQSRVGLPAYHSLKGMMHGFIDLIFEFEGKYYVCDYKSSHLGDVFDDYQQRAMRENIEHNHYDLQYLIYALALHRHLAFAISDYDPAQHFGGVYYLYLRGMTDEHEHNGRGVYYCQITPQELSRLDDLFSGVSAKQTGAVSHDTND